MQGRFSSVFDIVGPTMIGPSSSHTAGAARIGALARRILGKKPVAATITLYESFALTGRGHGTDIAILGGLMGLASHDPRLVESPRLAAEAGLQVKWKTQSRSPVGHPNTVRLQLEDGNGGSTDVIGVSYGGGNVEVQAIEEFEVAMSGTQPTLLVFHRDRAGAVAQVSTSLAVGQVNIAHMEVARQARGKSALMVIQLDQAPNPEVLSEISGLAVVLKARFCPPEGEAEITE